MEFTKKRHSGRALLVTGGLVLSLALTACGSANNDNTTTTANTTPGKDCKKVGVLLPETDSSARWDSKDRPALTDGIKAKLPDATVLYNNAQGSATTQQTQAEADLANGACILVVAPVDGDASAAIVASAKAKNVPVIAYDRLIYSDDLSYYVSFDNEGVGKLQGQYIAEHYKDFVKGNNNNTVMINGGQTDNNALLFEKGAHETLQPLFDNKSLNLVYSTFTDKWDNAKAQTEMEGALTANANNVQIAYVANDGMAGTVIAALKAHNLNGKVLVTGQDATVSGIQNILTGDQAMTVYKNISKESSSTADLVAAISKGTDTASITNGLTVKNPKGSKAIASVLAQAVIVDKSNIIDTVLKDGFVTKADICKNLPAGTDTKGICS
ncbi:ABC transporter substrate-binding protein [Tengunoibacter tsumagoiensis]|uniref:Sugar ABC transporter substrate-binding protein n=1 Tax=Tengunoibacter tsumagoiensis TaxID=2014871 RepID=A0A402AAP9_9CHLR|nr:sugar ABC transporter substrate-binding protein [Tengunoibacter tsumagoiensis]GCE16189.1 sugar ABC transporter substrate-binding protein [Tengunoibacter tsumagoiensis]